MNSPSKFHNQILKREVKRLNKESRNIHQKSAFVILNLYKSFWSSLKKEHHKGRLKFKKNALKPCCVGLSSEYSCASVDDKGENKYSVCKHPELSFFWDTVHPSQSGWHAVYLSLRSSLHRLYK
ncbi:GDSL esterase/lipase [Melia azedarach]|uniref:GDSL esterase/lipase n=1 Tax=Melia azedarach TaxID=155640 RepID=A0ACC1YB02_MELAZ|nr:GDSL esterase/lipase [Melia azedarach]